MQRKLETIKDNKYFTWIKDQIFLNKTLTETIRQVLCEHVVSPSKLCSYGLSRPKTSTTHRATTITQTS